MDCDRNRKGHKHMIDAVITQVASICSLVLSIVAVVGLIVTAVKKAKAPNIRQDERLARCEEDIKRILKRLENDKSRFDEIEESNKIIMQAILALLSHGIDGNDVEAMKRARDSLQSYLIRR